VAQRGAHVGIPQHAGELAGARLAGRELHVAGGDATLRALGDDEVVIGEHGDLRQMGDYERLAAAAPARGHRAQRLPDPPSHFAADPLIHFVEHQARHGIVLRQHDLERQHQAGQLAPRRDLGERARLDPDVELNLERHILRPECVVRSAWLQPHRETAARYRERR